MPPSTEPHPAPPGRSSTLIPPVAAIVVPGMNSPGSTVALVVPPSSVPLGKKLALGFSGKAVAIGVPRVSTESPRLGWLPLTKLRSFPRRIWFHE